MRRYAIVLALVGLAACGSEPAATLVTPGPLPSSTPSGPTIQFESPADGATLPLGDIAVSVKVGGFRLVDKLGSQPGVGEGHIVFYRNVDFMPTAPGAPAVTADGTSKATATPSATWNNIEPSTYVLGAQLVNNDDTPLVPPVTDQVKVTVSASASSGEPRATPASNSGGGGTPTAGAPAITVTMPKPGSTTSGDRIDVKVQVSGFRLVDKVGQAPQAGEGHIIYYRGQDYDIPTDAGRPATSGGRGSFTAVPSTTTSHSWADVPRGQQTFAVQLVNNDDTPLSPPRQAEVTVSVT
jgi:hypothetical protein